MRRHLARRLEKLRTSSRVTASAGAPSGRPVRHRQDRPSDRCPGRPAERRQVVRLSQAGRLGGKTSPTTRSPLRHRQSHVATLDNLSVQIVDLPPLAEGSVDGLPYGEKLRPIIGLADIVCVVLDASGDIESQELVLAEELDSPRRTAAGRVDSAGQPGARRGSLRRTAARSSDRYAGALALRSRLRRRAPARREGWRIRSHTRQAAGPAGRGSGSAVGEARVDRRRPGSHRPRRPRAAADRRPRVGASPSGSRARPCPRSTCSRTATWSSY